MSCHAEQLSNPAFLYNRIHSTHKAYKVDAVFCAGMRKTYWITCNVEPNIQHLSLDRRRFPSNFVVRPRDLNRLLANFQSSLQEITIIATEPNSLPSDVASEIGGKAVELRSYIDPTKGIKYIFFITELTRTSMLILCFYFFNCR